MKNKKWIENGILDPNGKYNNPINEKIYSSDYKSLAKKWSKLMAYEKRYQILDTIDKYSVILLVSSTGTGKSLLVPKLASHYFNYQKDKKIIMTNPKRLSTLSNALFNAKTLDTTVGGKGALGILFKDVSKEYRANENTLITYATDGYVLAKMKSDPLLSEYSVLILDESHERNINLDILFLLARNIIPKRPDFKLIIMSATINSGMFIKYFDEPRYNFGKIELVKETTFKLETYFATKPIGPKDFVKAGVKIIHQLLKSTKDGDIILFLTSRQETIDACEFLKELFKKEDFKSIPICYPLYSGLNQEKQKLIEDKDLYKSLKNEEGKNYTRKIVCSTNVAESSITIDNLKYVVDSGWELNDRYNYKHGSRSLKLERISQANAKQRWGRVGRTQSGEVYLMYTEDEYNKFLEYPIATIMKSNLTEYLLQLLDLGKNFENLNKLMDKLIERPENEYILSGINILNEFKCVTIKNKKNNQIFSKENVLSDVGKFYNKFSLDIIYLRCILMAFYLDCRYEVTTIIAMLLVSGNNMNEFLYKRKGLDMKDFHNKVKRHMDKKSDMLTLLNIYELYQNKRQQFVKNGAKGDILNQKLMKWCDENYLHYKSIRKVRPEILNINNSVKREMDSIRAYTLRFKKSGISKLKKIKNNILLSLMYGFYINTAQRVGRDRYKNWFPTIKTTTTLSRNSSVVIKQYEKKLDKIMYGELFEGMNGSEFTMISYISPKVYKEAKKICDI